MIGVSVLVTCVGLVAVLAAGWSGRTIWWLWLVVPAGGLFIAFCCRLLMVGVYVNGRGVRVQRLLRSDIFAWGSVLAVRTQTITRAAPDSPVVVQARQVCFDLNDGRTIETPIHGQARGGRRPWQMPDILSTAEFDRVLANLRHSTAQHRRQ